MAAAYQFDRERPPLEDPNEMVKGRRLSGRETFSGPAKPERSSAALRIKCKSLYYVRESETCYE